MARLDRRALDDGRSAVSSSSSWISAATSPSATARQPCHTAGPSSRPIVSSSTASSHACRPAASAIVPSLVALSKPSEYANPPIGKSESHRCNSSSLKSQVSMLVSGHCRGGGERHRRSRVGHLVLLEQQFDAGHVGTDQSLVRDHQRLVAIADVVRE